MQIDYHTPSMVLKFSDMAVLAKALPELNHDQEHYYIQTQFGFGTTSVEQDIVEVWEHMCKSDVHDKYWNLYYVPAPASAEYEIDGFVPQVEGTQLIARSEYSYYIDWYT